MMGENDWFDIWLSAKVLTIRSQYQAAMAQLVNNASRNPYVPEIFALLAETLLATGNVEKANSCIQRARSLKPQNENFAQLQDRILLKMPKNNECRLEQLTSFLKGRPTSRWALKEASIIELTVGKLDEAIEKFQKLIRFSNNNEETSALWSFLGEAYKRKGRLQSAVSAFKAMLEYDSHSYTAHLQLAQLYVSMTHFEEANRELELLNQNPNFPDNLKVSRDILQAQVGLNLASEEENVEKKIARLSQVLLLLRSLQQRSNNALLRRLLAEGFEMLLSFNRETLDAFIKHTEITYGWKIEPSDVSDEQIRSLAFLLRAHPNSGDCWNELALALIHRYLKATAQPELLDKAINCLKNAISLPSSAIKRASFWCNMGLAYLFQKKLQQAQHCWIRAVQLNRHNDTAWGLLAILYLRIGRTNEAFLAIQTAQKLNPNLMEAWAANALYREIEKPYESMDLYRHSLVLKPSEVALKKYSFYLAKCFKEKIKIDEGTMIDLKNVMRLAGIFYVFLLSIAIFAEHFGYLEEASNFVDEISSKDKFANHINRIYIKATKDLKISSTNAYTSILQRLYHFSLQDLRDSIGKYSPARELLSALQENDPSHIREFYKPNLYPLLVSFSILYKKEISQKLMEEIEEIRPLHKLFDVYPPTFKKPEELITKENEDKIVLRDEHFSEVLF
uniref:Uncharacterized protein n=1 Tax=Acrobeloides nanus TaxID=290746 RepID=A0A914CLV9_9BILA